MRPRIRTLKPEIWADERIGELSHGARLLFIGLITMADDEGRLRELGASIIGHTFPYDQVSGQKLGRWLKEVEQTGMVVRYEADGRRYLAFRRWSRHQKVDKPSPSELPPPPQFSSNHSTNDPRKVPEVIVDHSRSLRAHEQGDPIPSDPGGQVIPIRGRARAHFDYWREQCGHPDAKFTDERRRKIEARTAEGYTDEQIRTAIDGAAKGAFVNDVGKRFDDIELICRNGSKLESFIDRAQAPPAVAAAPTNAREARLQVRDERQSKRMDAVHRLAAQLQSEREAEAVADGEVVS